jgi:hypothetical protein
MRVYAAAKRRPEAIGECRAAVALARKLDPRDTAIADIQSQCDQLADGSFAALANK